MSEYKPLKEYEIVPGMIFENNSGSKITIIQVYDHFLTYIGNCSNGSESRVTNTVPLKNCTRMVKLIHDPRKGSTMSIQEQIEEHKKQIKILENQLQEEVLVNLFEKDNIYRIKTVNHDSIVCKYISHNDPNMYNKITEIYTNNLESELRIFSIKMIQKVWLINDLNDLFSDNPPIFERY